MSQISRVFFGALAISLACGAVQFASGHDLTGRQQAALAAPDTGINRVAKADRSPVQISSPQTKTIALRLDGLADTSVLIRMPIAHETRNLPMIAKSGGRKATVACEPVVSVLTDVAKLLQPGRCVT